MRFLNRQPHKGACGVVALTNAVKWHGLKMSYDKMYKFCKELRAFDSKNGMQVYQMNYVLRTLKLPFWCDECLTTKHVHDVLKHGGSLILIYDTSKGNGHCVFLHGFSGHFLVWNPDIKDGSQVWSNEELQERLQRGGSVMFYFDKQVRGHKW